MVRLIGLIALGAMIILIVGILFILSGTFSSKNIATIAFLFGLISWIIYIVISIIGINTNLKAMEENLINALIMSYMIFRHWELFFMFLGPTKSIQMGLILSCIRLGLTISLPAVGTIILVILVREDRLYGFSSFR